MRVMVAATAATVPTPAATTVGAAALGVIPVPEALVAMAVVMEALVPAGAAVVVAEAARQTQLPVLVGG